MTTDTRAVSATLGVVLLFAMVIAGMVATVAIGATAFDQTKDELGASRAEKTLTQFDSKSAVVALGRSDSQSVALAAGEDAGYSVREGSGWMNITVENTTSGEHTTVANVTLGAVVYENGEATLAYQGGGVWKGTGSGATMVSPPEFHFRNATLTLPIISVSGTAGIDDRALVTKNGTTLKRYPNATLDENFTNPLTDGKVTVTVKSEYYRAWSRYFARRTAAEVVDVDPSSGTTTVELTVPTEPVTINAAVTATGTNLLKLETSGAGDTYDSSEGPYSAPAPPAPIRTAGDVKVENTIEADVYSGADVTVEGTLDGNACAAGSVSDPGTITGWKNDTTCDVGIQSFQLPDSTIDSEVSTHSGSNNNSDTVCVVSDDIVADCTDDLGNELTAGAYYLGGGETITNNVDFDTSGGPVEVVVDGDLTISGGVLNISTEDPIDGVTFYVDGKLKVEGSPQVKSDENQSAGLVTFKIASGNGVKMEGGSVVGVVYAPGSGCSSTIKTETGAELFGALVVECADNVETGGTIHYDQALQDGPSRTISASKSISYLHISVNDVNVTSA